MVCIRQREAPLFHSLFPAGLALIMSHTTANRQSVPSMLVLRGIKHETERNRKIERGRKRERERERVEKERER